MQKNSRKKHHSPYLKYVLLFICTVIISFFIFKKITDIEPAITEEQQFSITDRPQQEARSATKTIQPEENTISETPTSTKENNTDSAYTDRRSACQKANDNIERFFSQLEKQEYIKSYELNDNVRDHLNKLSIKLLNNPPIITGETDNLLLMLKNSAHFYRILGNKDISLLKDILVVENEEIENIMASLFDLSPISGTCQEEPVRFRLPLKKAYEYSAFFINTLSGQSYLFRRESKTRVLINYYAALVLEAAAQRGLNNYGINIQQIKESTIKELQESDSLIYTDKYIKRLSLQNP